MLEISDNLKINLNAVVTINKVKDKWIARLKNGSSLVVTEEIANEIITSTGSSGGGGGGASITANIKITNNKSDILGTTEHNKLCILSGTGDVVEPEDGRIAAIGSGGNYALSAARALDRFAGVEPKELVQKSLEIAGELCIYTNQNIKILEL